MARTANWGIEVRGLNSLKRAMKILAETDAPFLRAALEEAGQLLRGAAASRAPGSIASAVSFAGVRGKGAQLRATIRIKHPGANSMEFGRVMYYQGYHGRQVKATGQRVRRPGQQARPFLGIVKGGAAIGEVEERVKTLIQDAFEKEWERIAQEGDTAA